MIRSLDDAVKDYVAPIQLYETSELVSLFETPHNRTITGTISAADERLEARCGANQTGPIAPAPSRANG